MCMKKHREEIRQELTELCVALANAPRKHGTGCSKMYLNQGNGPCVACKASPSIVLGVYYLIRHPCVAKWVTPIQLSHSEAKLMAFLGTVEFQKLVNQQRTNLRNKLFRTSCPVCKDDQIGITYPFIEKDFYNNRLDLINILNTIMCPKCHTNIYLYLVQSLLHKHQDRDAVIKVLRETLIALKLESQPLNIGLITDLQKAEAQNKTSVNSNSAQNIKIEYRPEELQAMINNNQIRWEHDNG